MRASRRAVARWERSDSGITTLQVLIMFPVIVVLLGISLQVALDYYAKQVALGAAQAGVNAVRYAQLGPNDEAKAETIANAAAQDYVTSHGGNFLESPTLDKSHPLLQQPVDSFTYTWQVNVRIKGTPLSLLPILTDPINQQASAPLENFTWGLS